MTQYTHQSLQLALKEKGMKATVQRLVTLKELLQCSSHPTAEELHTRITISNPTISLATVYKTLDTLVENNLASRVHTTDGYMRYDGNTNSHNHIFCSNTNEIIDYEDKDLSRLLIEYFNKKAVKNLKIEDIQVQINGKKINTEKDILIK